MILQSAVQTLLQDFIDREVEQGLQVAAYYRGELLVDAWAGWADATRERPVNGETLFVVYSASKGIAATAAHILVEQGELDYDRPLADYWPEFADGGKDRVTLRHVLTHTAALPHLPPLQDPAELLDWMGMREKIARLAPLWTPGTALAYHAITYGWLVGEVVHRVTGLPFARFVQEAICAPLDIDSLFFGVPASALPRVAVIEGRAEDDIPPKGPIAERAIPPFARMISQVNRPDYQRAVLPASGGIMNARALARHYAALVGAVEGVRLLQPATVAYAGHPHWEGIDANGGHFTRYALGYHSGRPGGSLGARAAVFGHNGFGGTMAFADPEYEFAFALTKNRVVIPHQTEDGVAYQVANLIREQLGIPGE